MSAGEINYSRSTRAQLTIHHFSIHSPRYLLLVVHGYGDAVGKYAEMAGAFTRTGAYVFGPDLPGHGLSAGENLLIEDLEPLVDSLRSITDEARWQYPGLPLFVLGHSMGGMIATRYAQRFRHGMAGLILAAPLLGETTRITRLMDGLHKSATGDIQRFSDETTGAGMMIDRAGTVREWFGPFRRQTLSAMKRMLMLAHSGPGFGSLPVLWIHGKEDSTVLAEETETTLERLRGSRYRKLNIEKAGHNLFTGDAWPRTVSSVQTFIEDILRSDGKRNFQTVFHFCPCFLPWTLSRTWTLPWTETRLTPEDPGSPPHSACGLTTP
ncbi:MAG: alpha/beta fold hydrolase [Pantoea sp.]|uniref:alpha/beta hydrolase n=1 Tax=Pantoea sp. TaxID=69393 RepID=UPI0039E53FBF